MGSIEAAFISLARYIRDHFPDLNWMPLWYGGIPYPDSYPPLLHMLVASVSGIGRVSPGLAYHAVTATIYCLGPVALYWAACRLGADRRAAFAAALGYSLISPSLWFSRALRHDVGGWFGPCRLDAMVRYGEGPHITSLFFLALAIGAMYAAIERRRASNYLLAALAMAAVALSNWIGAFALAAVVASLLLAGVPGSLRLPAIGLYAYAIASPFVTPSTAATIQANAPTVAGGFKANHLLEAAFAVSILAVAWALRGWIREPRIRFAVLFAWMMCAITLPAYWFRLWVIPQPERYHLEMDLALWLTAALIIGAEKIVGQTPWSARDALVPPVVRRINPEPTSTGRPGGRPQTWGSAPLAARRLVTVLLLAFCAVIAIREFRRAREIEKPIAIRSTVEYEISRWLGDHMPGRRVFAPGTIGYWMEAFSDTPMLTGGFDNGIRNTFLQEIIYQIYAGDRQDVMLGWLRAFGMDAVIGAGPESREYYHPYAHPEKFAGMRVIWRDNGDAIYAVPRSRPSLAYAMPAADIVTQKPPAYSIDSIRPYLRALDDPTLPAARFQWRGTGAAEITGNFRPEHLLSVQVTWDKGWRARVNGQPRSVWGDKLGQVVIEPRCDGPCTIKLEYDGGGAEMLLARCLSIVALAAGLIGVIWQKYSGSMKAN